MAQQQAFITYQEAARLTGKTVRTIRRKIHSGIIAESQTRKHNGQVTIAVAELPRVFGDPRPQGPDNGGDKAGQGRTLAPDMSAAASGVWREYLDFTKAYYFLKRLSSPLGVESFTVGPVKKVWGSDRAIVLAQRVSQVFVIR